MKGKQPMKDSKDILPKKGKFPKSQATMKSGEFHKRKDFTSRNRNVEDLNRKVNDPQFYNKYRSLCETAAKWPFNHRNGQELLWQAGSAAIPAFNIDAIMRYNWIPTPGKSTTKASGINVACEAQYKVLNRKYRGSPSGRYQSADLGIAQFAILDYFCSLAQAERAYGVAQYAVVNQKQLPRELLIMMGFNPDDVMLNLAKFRYGLNHLIIRSKSLCLVKGYTLLDHFMFLSSNIFKDHEGPRAQFFFYHKPGFWKWEPTHFTSGSALVWKEYDQATNFVYTSYQGGRYLPILSVDEIIFALNEQLNALLDDSDIDAMCSDILAYFGNEDNNPNIVQVSDLPEDYTVTPVFNKDLLMQTHNLVSLSTFSGLQSSSTTPSRLHTNLGEDIPVSILPTGYTSADYTGLYIYQQDGIIKFNVKCADSGTRQLIGGNTMVLFASSSQNFTRLKPRPIIDTDSENPDTDEVLELTRFCAVTELETTDVSGTNYYAYDVATHGTTLVVGGISATFRQIGQYSWSGNIMTYNALEADEFQQYLTTGNWVNYSSVSRFDWAPIFYGYQIVFGDLDNYRSYDYNLLYPVHEAAILSEFHNPMSDILIADQ